MRKHIGILCLILTFALPGIAAEREVSLATLEWPPFVGANLEQYGFASKIITAAFERVGYTVHIEFMPWTRVLAGVEKGRYDAGYPAYYSDERAQTYALSAPLARSVVGFYTHKDAQIVYTNLQDLEPYKIGVVRGYVNNVEFDASDYLKKFETNSDLQNLRLVFYKRIDLVFIDKFVAEYLLKTALPEARDGLEFLNPPLEIKPLYLIFSRNIPGYEQKLQDFNRGLKQIREDGTIRKIIEQSGFEDSMIPLE